MATGEHDWREQQQQQASSERALSLSLSASQLAELAAPTQRGPPTRTCSGVVKELGMMGFGWRLVLGVRQSSRLGSFPQFLRH